MSRAYGTAFLTHQVAQLEKAVFNGDRNSTFPSRGSGRGVQYATGKRGRGGRGGGGRGGGRIPVPTDQHPPNDTEPRAISENRLSGEAKAPEKVADRLVLDASVLIHALGKVREWCRDRSKEIIIVPLEGKLLLDELERFLRPSA